MYLSMLYRENLNLVKVVDYLNLIGIKTKLVMSTATSFFEEIEIVCGELLYTKTVHLGNLLHEAGHIATAPSEMRCLLCRDLQEIKIENYNYNDIRYQHWTDKAAIGWSLFTALELGLPTSVLYEGLEATFPDGKLTIEGAILSLGSSLGSCLSVDLYYAKMLKSKRDRQLCKVMQD
jgi:hypothetical protein